MAEILVLYYSPGGTTAEMANVIARGIEQVEGMQARIRTVPPVSAVSEQVEDAIPGSGPLYASNDDLEQCSGLVMGAPTHFGNMPAALKHFIDNTSPLWMSGALVGKPAGVFTASTSLHGGQETTLVSMMLPLLHHGMLLVGLPYSETELLATRTGGTPYGATTLAAPDGSRQPSNNELAIARFQGRHVAEIARRLKAGS
mgnify:CR=1 FL=1